MDNQAPSQKAPSFCSLRFSLAILLQLCNMIMVSQRSCLNLTIVAMVNRSEPHGVPNASTERPLDNSKNPVYNWSPQSQGIILSSILYSMPVAQIIFGYLSGIYPIRKIISSALLLSSLCNLLLPLAAGGGEAVVIVCRLAQGLCQGTLHVAQYVVWIKWAPPLERSQLTSMSVAGNMLGPSIAMFMAGFITQSLGWPMVFYIFGAIGLALSLLWFIMFYDEPGEHPCISLREKEFITSSLAQQTSSAGTSVPIRAMLKSRPVWAITLTTFAFAWMNNAIYFYMPTFFNSKLHINLQDNGLVSGLPYLLAWICSLLSGHLADFLLTREVLRLLTIRKLFTMLGLLPPSIFLVSLLHPSSTHLSTITCLTLASAMSGLPIPGMMINAMDIAPRYFGFLKGVTTMIGMIGGLMSSTLAGIILAQDPESSWSKIFLLMAAINVMSLIFYLLFAEVEIQDWAKEKQLTRL